MTSRWPETNQISRHVFLDMTDDPTMRRLSAPYRQGGYIFMLLEDCRAFPVGNDLVQATLTQEGEAVPDWDSTVAKALDHGSHRRADLGRALEHFSESCLHQVLLFGEAAYEIAYTDPDADGHWQGFRLALVHPYRHRFGRHRHYKAATGDLAGEWVTIPNDRMVVFDLVPKELRSDLKWAVNALKTSNRNWFGGLIALADAGVSIADATRADATLLAGATRKMGWNVRFGFQEYATHPYLVLRDLRFAWLRVKLREMVVAGVQEALDKTVPVLKVRSTLHVECHPTLVEIEAAMAELQTGPGRNKSLWQLESPLIF